MGPLHGFRVVEMAGLAPGPFCGMMLADMGAEVLRIQRPTVADPSVGAGAHLLNRGRRSLAIDLKSDAGIAAVLRLVKEADALIEGFRPGVMERLGLGPDVCLETNPRLVYGRVTGWGQDGPLAQAAGHDVNYLALTGALHSIGRKGEPPVMPLNLVGDFGGGGLYLAFGIVCGLLEASRSGKGQVVDAAMVDGIASLMTYIHGVRGLGNWSDERGENLLAGASPMMQPYETRDGEYITIAAIEKPFYSELLRRIGLNEDELPSRDDRAQWPALREKLADVFRSRTRQEWCELLEGTNACFSPVLSIPEAVEHPHNKARGTFIHANGYTQPAPAPRFSRTGADTPKAEVPAGREDEKTLAAWGFDVDEVRRLQREGALGTALG